MYAAIDNGYVMAVCHDANNAWATLSKLSGSYRDAEKTYERLAENLPLSQVDNPAILGLLRDTVLRLNGVGVTRVVQDASGDWRATNY